MSAGWSDVRLKNSAPTVLFYMLWLLYTNGLVPSGLGMGTSPDPHPCLTALGVFGL